jgi:hypothetical protein
MAFDGQLVLTGEGWPGGTGRVILHDGIQYGPARMHADDSESSCCPYPFAVTTIWPDFQRTTASQSEDCPPRRNVNHDVMDQCYVVAHRSLSIPDVIAAVNASIAATIAHGWSVPWYDSMNPDFPYLPVRMNDTHTYNGIWGTLEIQGSFAYVLAEWYHMSNPARTVGIAEFQVIGYRYNREQASIGLGHPSCSPPIGDCVNTEGLVEHVNSDGAWWKLRNVVGPGLDESVVQSNSGAGSMNVSFPGHVTTPEEFAAAAPNADVSIRVYFPAYSYGGVEPKIAWHLLDGWHANSVWSHDTISGGGLFERSYNFADDYGNFAAYAQLWTYREAWTGCTGEDPCLGDVCSAACCNANGEIEEVHPAFVAIEYPVSEDSQ